MFEANVTQPALERQRPSLSPALDGAILRSLQCIHELRYPYSYCLGAILSRCA